MLAALLAFGRGMCCAMRVRVRVRVSGRDTRRSGKGFIHAARGGGWAGETGGYWFGHLSVVSRIAIIDRSMIDRTTYDWPSCVYLCGGS